MTKIQTKMMQVFSLLLNHELLIFCLITITNVSILLLEFCVKAQHCNII